MFGDGKYADIERRRLFHLFCRIITFNDCISLMCVCWKKLFKL